MDFALVTSSIDSFSVTGFRRILIEMDHKPFSNDSCIQLGNPTVQVGQERRLATELRAVSRYRSVTSMRPLTLVGGAESIERFQFPSRPPRA